MKQGFLNKSRWVTPNDPVLHVPEWPTCAWVSFLFKRRRGGDACDHPDDNLVRQRRGLPFAPGTPSALSKRECQFAHRLRRKARTCLKFLEKEFRLKRAHALPSRIQCGYLKSAVRSCFDHLDEVQELSVKTTQKLEKSYCPTCISREVEPKEIGRAHV